MYLPGQAFCSHDALEDELHSKLSKHGVASLNVVEGVFITFLHAWEVPLQELSWPIVAHILPSQYTFTVPPTYYTFEVKLESTEIFGPTFWCFWFTKWGAFSK